MAEGEAVNEADALQEMSRLLAIVNDKTASEDERSKALRAAVDLSGKYGRPIDLTQEEE